MQPATNRTTFYFYLNLIGLRTSSNMHVNHAMAAGQHIHYTVFQLFIIRFEYLLRANCVCLFIVAQILYLERICQNLTVFFSA